VIENLIEDIAHSLGSWAYLLVAVMATAETAAFAGFIAPGEVTIIIGGVLAGEGTLSIQLLIGIVWASIVLGDSIGFMIGRRYGRNFLLKHGPKIRLTEERLKQVEDYFKRHGGKTIFFGRWVGFVRPLMPFTAGSSGLPYSRFLPYDVLSAGLFGATFSLLGYIFWRNFDTVASIVGRGALGLGILVALIIGGVWTFKRLRHEEQRRRLAA
jgi:membrane protein DedA with SNARE-associated domain